MKTKIMRLLLKALGVLAILSGLAVMVRRETVTIPWQLGMVNSVLLGIVLLEAKYNEN